MNKIISFTLLLLSISVTVKSLPYDSPDWELTFEDEFEGTELNENNWTIKQRESHCCPQEQQIFFKENIKVKDGHLIIETKHEIVQTSKQIFNYTSGWIDSRLKVSQHLGKFEIRCKLPPSEPHKPIWPAFWTKPDGCYKQPSSFLQTDNCPPFPWPIEGEIDILEYMSDISESDYQPAQIGSYHVGTQQGKDTCGGICTDPFLKKPFDYTEFHTYTVIWTEETMTWYVDGEGFRTMENSDKITHNSAPFPTVPHFLIINQSVSPRTQANPHHYPKYLTVDYVKIWKQKDSQKQQQQQQQ